MNEDFRTKTGMIGDLSNISLRESFLPKLNDVILVHNGQIKVFENALKEYHKRKIIFRLFGFELSKLKKI